MFIRNRTGSHFINSDAVARTERLAKTVRGDEPVDFFDSAGRKLGTLADAPDLERLSAPVIGASGEIAVFVSPSGETVCVPIAGYRLMPQGAEPVLLGDRPAGEMFVFTASGVFVGSEDPFRRLFVTLDDARGAVMAAHAALAPAPGTPAPTPAAA